ncbi:MAG: HlyD family efflux transporter periplasmic adaptor subunit [Planctomycetaceae bacterium]|nr:HlyD family efflux transporter periplasmic adaptor subunit [Planctomycetaceae bacterium]
MFASWTLLNRLGIPGLATAMLSLGIYHVRHESPSLPPLSPLGRPSPAPEGAAVAASGVVESRSEDISVGAALSGIVLEVYVPADRVGTHVEVGTPLFQVDDRHLRAELEVARARLGVARERLSRLEALPRPEEIPPSQARVRAAEEAMKLARDRAVRSARLHAKGAASVEEAVDRDLEYRAACFELERSRKDHELLLAGAWGPEKAIARAEVAEAAAKVEQLATEVERALVRAPIAGDVLRVDVRPGEQVSATGRPLVVLGDVGALRVRVDIDEEDIARFRRGAGATAFARGDAGHPYALRFVRVEPHVRPKRSLTGDGEERVDTRVLQVVYELENNPRGPFVGQQMDVFVTAGSESQANLTQKEQRPYLASN